LRGVFALAGVALACAHPPALTSDWTAQPIAVDGAYNEWSGRLVRITHPPKWLFRVGRMTTEAKPIAWRDVNAPTRGGAPPEGTRSDETDEEGTQRSSSDDRSEG
jgi:hypothetical protein